mgnify:CR=1 FL=1
MTHFKSGWSDYLNPEKDKQYFIALDSYLQSKLNLNIYPPKDSWFKALEYSSFEKTKVIILGQDPYHGEGQAEGLSFSVPKGIVIPPSLRNILVISPVPIVPSSRAKESVSVPYVSKLSGRS